MKVNENNNGRHVTRGLWNSKPYLTSILILSIGKFMAIKFRTVQWVEMSLTSFKFALRRVTRLRRVITIIKY